MAQHNRRKPFLMNADRADKNNTRRNLLGAGVIAGAAIPFVPTSWKRPVVESVLLPAHAQSSPTEDTSDENESDQSGSSRPQTVSVTKECGSGPNNEYFTIVFPNDSAAAGSSFTIEGPFTTSPSVSGDNVRLRFSNDNDQVFLDDTTSGLNPIASPFCGNPNDSFNDSISLANGTNTLDFTVDINNQTNQVEIVIRDIVVN